MEPITTTKTVLHVGCGYFNPQMLYREFRAPGWKEIRLDIDPDVKPDIVANLTDMSPVATASVDAVWSSHNIEHLYAHEVALAFAEFHRVLKPGGRAVVTLPDLQEVAKHIAAGNLEGELYKSPAGPISPLDVVFGYRPSISSGNEFMAHRTGFTAQTLGTKLYDAGFARVDVKRETNNFNLWAFAHKAEAANAAGQV